MLKYFAYCRKSSEDADRQILSIDAQIAEVDTIVAERDLHLLSTLQESMSAKEPGRPVFNEMMRRIEAGEANAIVAWKLDRLARNFDDGGRIIGLLQRGVIKEIRTFSKTYLPTDNVLTIAVELGMANQYSRDLSANILFGIREKLRRGVFPGKAPLGYVNDLETRAIVPHPQHFVKVKRILERFSLGNMTLTAVQREFIRAGIIGRKCKRALPISSISNMLAKPFFYGAFLFKGVLHQGSHVPMLSKSTWDAVQAARMKVAKPRHNRKEKGFLFLHFATCGHCGYSICAERHIKRSGLRFSYYRCSHKSRKVKCENRSFVRDEKFATEVKRNVELCFIPSVWKERFLARVEVWENEQGTNITEQVARLRAELQSLNERITRLNDGFADGVLDSAEFREMKNPLIDKRLSTEQKIAALSKRQAKRLEPLRSWISEGNTLENVLSQNNWGEMKTFLRKVGSNHFLRGQTLTVSFLNPWKSLTETRLAALNAGAREPSSEKWWSLGDSNP